MRLLAKFNLIFTLVFGAGLAGAGYVSYWFLQRNAREEVVQQASARDYTIKQVRPLLEADQARDRKVPGGTRRTPRSRTAWPK